ncbi:hypothetical protein LENED_003192 [Lentinula edodes]|uniref:Uncharacterized protein n=1 Tax=Lentinula edodes TaxID=5353 RepID=A0A1Q3E2Y0_LENED|nr:hypothetical protein LENED_003192 [Lentinula edodes]
MRRDINSFIVHRCVILILLHYMHINVANIVLGLVYALSSVVYAAPTIGNSMQILDHSSMRDLKTGSPLHLPIH